MELSDILKVGSSVTINNTTGIITVDGNMYYNHVEKPNVAAAIHGVFLNGRFVESSRDVLDDNN